MATTLVNLELDPIFLRALRLLHSKAKDSADQLRQMLEDVLQQRPINPQLSLSKEKSSSSLTGSKKSDNSNKIQLMHIKKSPKQECGVITSNLQSKKPSKDENKKREPEKRTFEKIKQDVVDGNFEVKKPKLESYKESSTNLSPPTVKLEIKQEDEESDLGNTDADDFAMEMGLACVVCRNIDVSSGNQLVECQECHNLYHQECHKPPITDQDVNDPRLAWYCAKCTKNIKKLATKSQKPSKTVSASVTKEHANVSKTNKPETTSIIASSRLFKRTEVKSPLSLPIANNNINKNSSSSNKPTGLAGLAASLSGRSNSTKVSQSSTGGKSAPNSKTASNSNKSTSNATQLTKSNSFSVSSSSKTHSSNGNHSSKLSLQSKSTSNTNASTSNNGSSGNGGNTSSNTSSNGNSGSSSSSSNHNNGKNSMIVADKRLQIMKKKAEKKMQEKRRK